MTVVGIDLGTTYSVIARLDESGRPQVLHDPAGEETVPSVVCFPGDGSVLVGTAAKEASMLTPDRTVALIKRTMGTGAEFFFDDVAYSSEAISSLILRALVEGVLPPGEPVQAVVTVPAYFGTREKESTYQACELAGIQLLELLAEPVAAAIHYGFQSDRPATVLVYDLGGGTFDVTVLQLGAESRVVATDGDTMLGGADWDRRLTDLLLERATSRTTFTSDPADDPEAMAELALQAERVKRRLSAAGQQAVTLRLGGVRADVDVSRQDFVAATRDLLDRSFDCVRRVLAQAEAKGVRSIDHALLVGGSSRMPAIAEALRREFGWDTRLLDPDFAVAKGAAIRAGHLVRDERLAAARGLRSARPAVDVAGTSSVVARSLGLYLHDSYDPTGTRCFIQHVIHQNDQLPVVGRQAQVATIVDGQRTVHIQLYEQAGSVPSEEVRDNRRVLEGEFSGLPDLPAGALVLVTISLDGDGRISLSATDSAGKAHLNLEAYLEGALDHETQRTQAASVSALTIRQ